MMFQFEVEKTLGLKEQSHKDLYIPLFKGTNATQTWNLEILRHAFLPID